MSSQRWRLIRQVFNSALDLEPGRRDTFVREACQGDPSLLREIRSLLLEEGESKDILDAPPLEFAARALAEEEAGKRPENFTGRTLRQYQLEEKIGQGGMGEVYRARDTRLGRTVALKILPPAFAVEEDRMRRFLREAKTASALCHPNVATIFEVGEAEGLHFISMEHVDGQTLSEYSHKRRIDPGQVIKIGIQLAEALEEAHEKRIIHRDLKPANIMLTPRGQVKILDFGLAKLARQATPGDDSESLTDGGRIIGTAAFMSPEQVLGHPLDHRTDIFSLGAVLYQLATGRSPFAGGTTTEVMDRILHSQPERISRLNRKTPPELERMICKCLEKDRSLRYQTTAALLADLLCLKRDLESVKPALRRRRKLVPALVVGVGVFPLLALAGWLWVKQPPSTPLDSQLIPIPLTAYRGFEHTPSFSPDGTQVAFVWDGREGNWDIYLKQIGVEPPFRLTSDPAEDYSPAWSPDGRYIAFLRGAKLMLVPQRGGQERFIAKADLTGDDSITPGRCLAWTPDSKWLAFPSRDSGDQGMGLFLVSIETLEKKRLTRSPAAFIDGNPAFRSDGQALAFARYRWEVSSEIYVLRCGRNYDPVTSPQKMSVSEANHSSSPAWTPDGTGYSILFSSSGSLWRMPVSAAVEPKRVSFAFDAFRPAVSPQGNRLAYSVFQWDPDIWELALDNRAPNYGIPSKLISSTRVDDCPTFSPDGKKIAFYSDRSGSGEIWVCDRDGSDAVQLTSLRAEMTETLPPSFAPRWSPDGRNIVFAPLMEGGYQVLVVAANGGLPHRVAPEAFTGPPWPNWSADSQSIYFRSLRGQKSRIWKAPAAGGEPSVVSSEPADQPRESPDGKFLYYTDGWYGHWSDVWRMPAGGGEATKVVNVALGVEGPYDVVEDGIYFIKKSERKDQVDLYFLSFETGRNQKIQTIPQPYVSFIEVSPDRRTVLYTHLDQRGSDLKLVENFR